MMVSRLQQLGLVLIGLVLGVLVSMQLSAVAEKDAGPLPIEDLRAFTEVFGRITWSQSRTRS
jgi:carboxyl-terminal processing protease